MDKDRVKGAAKKAGGRVEKAVGDLTGSDRLKAKGQIKEGEGKIQNTYGKAKDTIRRGTK